MPRRTPRILGRRLAGLFACTGFIPFTRAGDWNGTVAVSSQLAESPLQRKQTAAWQFSALAAEAFQSRQNGVADFSPMLLQTARNVMRDGPSGGTIQSPWSRGTGMGRILIVAYRPHDGQHAAAVLLWEAMHDRALKLGVVNSTRPMFGYGTHGEMVVIVELIVDTGLDRLWDDEIFQDLNARLAALAVMIPVRNLDEASAMYMDVETIRPTG